MTGSVRAKQEQEQGKVKLNGTTAAYIIKVKKTCTRTIYKQSHA
jgi:hypothetical protein